MLKIKFKTIRTNLFTYYSIFFISFLILIALFLHVFFTNYTTRNISEQQVQLINSIVNSLNQEVTKMSNFSMNIVYSNLVKDHFQNNLTPDENDALQDPDRFSEVTTLIDVMIAGLSSTQMAKQANIYDFNGKMIGAGFYNGQLTVDLLRKSWYEKTLAMDGNKYLDLINNSQLSSAMIQKNIQNYVSLTRVYKDGNYVSQGIIEILQDAEILFKYLDDLKRGNQNLQMFVLDAEGNLFYPYVQQDIEEANYYKQFIDVNDLEQLKTNNVESYKDGSKEIMTFAETKYTGWTLMIVQSHKDLFAYLNQLNKFFFIALIIALFFTLIVTYIVAKKVTDPLKKLHQGIKKINIDNISTTNLYKETSLDHSLNEIEALSTAFNRMNRKLSVSLQELLTSKNQEMDARFLALQSQMNPHFLYNNLANISVMAEEGMSEEIVTLCNNMSYMLRYISTENSKGIQLYSELDYTEKYLNSMKLRYAENLTFDIDLPKQMNTIIVPKLIVQPLVENSVKHGLNTSPPWHITVRGSIQNGKWYITIMDNGLGFDPEVLEQFNHFMNTTHDLSNMPDLQINGMGMKNIFVRLKLMYSKEAHFVIENLPGQGVSITIGGILKF